LEHKPAIYRWTSSISHCRRGSLHETRYLSTSGISRASSCIVFVKHTTATLDRSLVPVQYCCRAICSSESECIS